MPYTHPQGFRGDDLEVSGGFYIWNDLRISGQTGRGTAWYGDAPGTWLLHALTGWMLDRLSATDVCKRPPICARCSRDVALVSRRYDGGRRRILSYTVSPMPAGGQGSRVACVPMRRGREGGRESVQQRPCHPPSTPLLNGIINPIHARVGAGPRLRLWSGISFFWIAGYSRHTWEYGVLMW